MATKTVATLEDLYRVPEHGKAELVDGEVVLMSPTGGLPGYAAGEIFASRSPALRPPAMRVQPQHQPDRDQQQRPGKGMPEGQQAGQPAPQQHPA
jgi:hypothetical protein